MGRPFIKWVGGKSQLLEEINKRMPETFQTYVEPFVGGGAVLFHVLEERKGLDRVAIGDTNPDLVNLYRDVKGNVRGLVDRLYRMQKEFIPLSQEERKVYYNARRDEYNRPDTLGVDKSALFVFLNKTCFNGLYRVNKQGKFNVPCGSYRLPVICDANTLFMDSSMLNWNAKDCVVRCCDFSKTLPLAKEGTFYYLDPPYRPVSSTSSFTSYTKNGFDDAEQERLARFCKDIDKAGGKFLLSNSDTGDGYFDKLYEGFTIERVQASRNVSCKGNGRGKVNELLIRNY